MSVVPESDPQVAGPSDAAENRVAIYRFLLIIAGLMLILLGIAVCFSMSATSRERARARAAEEATDAARQASAAAAEDASARVRAAEEKLSQTERALRCTEAALGSHHQAERRRSMARHTQHLATRPAGGPSWTEARHRRTLKAHDHAAKQAIQGTLRIKRKQWAEAEAVLVEALAELEASRPVDSDWLATRTGSWQWRILTLLESLYGPDALDRAVRRAVIGELVRRPSLNGAAALRGETTIVPASELGGTRTVLCLVGPPRAFKVTAAVGDVSVSPRAGNLPALLHVSADRPGLHPFAVDIDAGGKALTATGVLLVAEWDVRFFKGRADRRRRDDPAGGVGFIRGDPLARLTTGAVNFTWWDGSPAPPVPSDHFSTVATTSVRLDAGTYKVWTSADDGVRVWIDDDLLIDDWRWRPPRENATTVVLETGAHTIRIEHYETTKHAQLHFGMELLH